MHSSRSHDAVIRVYDKAGNVIETHEAPAKAKLAGSIETHPGDHLAALSAFRSGSVPRFHRGIGLKSYSHLAAERAKIGVDSMN
jgi:hypothetical protein